MGLYDHKRLAKKLEKSGKRAKAEVTRMVREGSYTSGRYTDDTDLTSGWMNYHLTLRVMPDGEAPFEAEARTRLYQSPSHGEVFDVLYDPADHKKVVVDYEGQYAASQEPASVTGPAAQAAKSADPTLTDPELAALADIDRMVAESGDAGLQAEVKQQMAENPRSLLGPKFSGNASPAAPSDPVERLKTLADLHDRGALTDAEFAAEKAKILSES